MPPSETNLILFIAIPTGLVTILSIILLVVAISTRRIRSKVTICCLFCMTPISLLYLIPVLCCSKKVAMEKSSNGKSSLPRHHNVKPYVKKGSYTPSRSTIECCISIASYFYHNSPIGCNFRSNVTLNEAILRYQENEEFLNADLTKKIDEEKLLYVILYLINEINPKYFFTVLPTGSLRERLGKFLPSTSILATDYDLMLIPDGIFVKVDDNTGSGRDYIKENTTPTLFEAVTGTNDIPPGYLWLKLTNDGLKHWNNLCFERLASGKVERYLSQLSIINLIRRSIGDTIDVKYFASLLYDKTNVKASVKRSGPAMTIKITGDKKKENTCFKNEMEAPMELFHADFTFGLYCPQLPVCALEKLAQLSVNANWPSREVIEKIMHIGCHVVPKPSKSGLVKYGAEQKIDSHLSQGSALEFRYSFSQAELLMSDSLPAPARTVYMALKAMVKFQINYKPDNWGNFHEIPSYVLKTLLFQTVETKPAEFWMSSNVLEVFFRDLYQSLVQVITDERCVMYWNPEINLLSDFDESAINWIRAKLETISMGGLHHFLLDDWIEMQRCIRLNCFKCCIGEEFSTVQIEQDMRPCSCQRKVACNNYDSCCPFGGMKLDEEVFDVY